MRPNFFIIGAQRSATGWISQCLREHPDIYLARDETRYFDKKYEKGMEWWESQYFTENGEYRAIGEKTANYLYDPQVPGRIHEHLPDVKLIVSLRDPVSRFNSAWIMKARTRPELRNMSFAQIIKQEPDLLLRGKYYEQLSRYYKLFHEQNILVLIYEDKYTDESLFIQNIYRFLDVDDEYVPDSLMLQTKTGAWENTRPSLLRITSRLLNYKSPLRRLYNYFRPESEPCWLRAEDIDYLVSYYEKDTGMLKSMLGRELDEWQQ